MKSQKSSKKKLRNFIVWRTILSALIALLAVLGIFAVMLKTDESNFRKLADRKNEELMQTLTEVEEEEGDMLLARCKTLLLDYVEDGSAKWQYGVLLDREHKVKISSKEAVRMRVQYGQFLTYYWSDSEEYLEWLKNGRKEFTGGLQEEPEPLDYSLFFTKMDAYFLKGGLLVPKTIYYSKIGLGEEHKPGQPVNRRSTVQHELSVKQEDYPEYDVITLTATQLVEEPNLSEVRGTHSQDGVFFRVNKVCEAVEHESHLGDVEVLFSQNMRTNSYQLRTYMGTNMILANRTRYIVACTGTGCSIFVLLFVLSLMGYWRRKGQYDQNLYRENLMNSLAHDLKTPLAAMSGYAENLIDDVQEEKREHYARAIKDNVEYMNSIIANVMLLAESENRKITKKDRLELISLCRELWEKYEPMAEATKIRAEFKGSFVIKGDRNLMISAMDNLLTNAIKYAKPGTVVTVIGGNGEFRITNEIEKAPETETEALWQPFIKGDNARGQRKGSGLGLSIVKNICDIHGLKAELICEGNTFTVRIQ